MTARFNGPLTWSLVAIGATLVAVLVNVPAIARALLMPRADAEQSFQAAAEEIWKRYDATEAKYLARFEGRSAFFEPPQERDPPPRHRPTTPRDEGSKPPPPPPPQPATAPRYSGPEPRTLHGDLAIFVDGTHLRVGETKGDLKLLAIEAPWIARVEYRGWAYERSLFARSDFDDYFQRETKPLGAADAPETGGTIGRAEDDVEPVQDLAAGAEASAAAADTAAERTGRQETADREGRETAGDPDEERDGRAARSAEVEIPEPLGEGQLESMSSTELRTHLGKLSRAKNALKSAADGADGELKERIDREWAMVLARLREVK